MAGSKRGGFRGGGSRAFKTGYTKKRSPGHDDDLPRASKKSKGDDDEEDEEDAAPYVPKVETDDANNQFVALNNSGKRRVTVSDFKGITLVSIREYYTNDAGELKPGKKGISLSLEQYNALLSAAPLLESVLHEKDVQVVRPDYDAAVADTKVHEGKDDVQQPVVRVDDDANEE